MVVDLFKRYYQAVFEIDEFRFGMTDSKYKTIENFVSTVKAFTESDMLHEAYMEKYFEYQFNHWYDYTSESTAGRIQIEWIVGKKAFERWKKADPIISAFVVRKNLRKDVNFKSRLEKENWNMIIIEPNEVEEREKERFHNTNQGYNYCLISTTLYNHKSTNCIACKNSTRCKENLKNVFPKIFKKRGYE